MGNIACQEKNSKQIGKKINAEIMPKRKINSKITIIMILINLFSIMLISPVMIRLETIRGMREQIQKRKVRPLDYYLPVDVSSQWAASEF